jgi:hypothetical protein
MASGRVQVTFDCADPAALATFWADVLGYPPPDIAALHDRRRSMGVTEEDLNHFCAIKDPVGLRPSLFFQRVPEAKVTKNRVHVDVGVSPGGPAAPDDVDREAARIVGLGGAILHTVADETGYFAVMADPEGNEFCVD